jgi:hypothetical protein
MTEEDAEIETAALVIEHLLHLVTPDKRSAVLARAVENEKEREEHGGRLNVIDAGDPEEWKRYQASPGFRYWNSIMQFKARLVYVFTRNITNNHSAADAAELLFARHRMAPGSGYLAEYIDRLPRPRAE